MKKKKYLKALLCCILIFILSLSLVACGESKPDPREKEIIQLLNSGKHDEAIIKAKELYKGEDKNLARILDYINEDIEMESRRSQIRNEVSTSTSKSTASSPKLEIQSGHTSKVKGDYYYVAGRVKNTSNSNITYFEVRCDFLDDNGQVLDSDYTNDNLLLKPGEMREFEIMHKYNKEYKNYKLSVGSVK